MMSAIKSGAVSHSRFAKMAEMDYKVSYWNSFSVTAVILVFIIYKIEIGYRY